MAVRATMLAPTAGLLGNLDDDVATRTVTFTADTGPVFVLAYDGVETQIVERLVGPRLRHDLSYFVGNGSLSWFLRPGDVWYHSVGPRPATTLGFTIRSREVLVTEQQRPRTFGSERGLGDVTPTFSETG